MWKAETTRWSIGFGRSDVENAITDGWSLGVREGRKTARDATMKIFIGAELRSKKLGDKDYGSNS